MNLTLAEMERTGLVELPSGLRVKLHSQVGPSSGRVLQHAIHLSTPRLGCEVGLAFGMSTLYILDAMSVSGGRLIGMDPAQHDHTWQGAGLENVRRAGFADRYELHEEPSQVVLPRLAAAGTRIQFAFVDGWHTFDHTLVDFFYLDQMLDVGGVLVVDDVGYPSIQRLCQFIVANRRYSIVEIDPVSLKPSWRSVLKRAAQHVLRPVVRDNFTPNRQTVSLQQTINHAQLIALRKEAHDDRRFDHFIAF